MNTNAYTGARQTICSSARLWLPASEGDSDIPHLRAQFIDTFLSQHRPYIFYYHIKCSNWKAIQEVFDPQGRFQENRKKNSFSSMPRPQIPVWVTSGMWQRSYNCWNANKSLHCFISRGNSTGYRPVCMTEKVQRFLISTHLTNFYGSLSLTWQPSGGGITCTVRYCLQHPLSNFIHSLQRTWKDLIS